MAHTFPAGLTTVINTGWWRYYPAVIITLTSGSVLKYSTINITVGSNTYLNKLKKVGRAKQGATAPIDRVEFEMWNADAVSGQTIVQPEEALDNAKASFYAIYINAKDSSDKYEVEKLAGVLDQIKAGDEIVRAQIISDAYAMEHAVGNVAVDKPCQWIYKDPTTCGYAGGITACDRTFDGSNGCRTHFPNDEALSHFGGAGLFLDDQTLVQLQSNGVSTGAGGGSSSDDGNPPDIYNKDYGLYGGNYGY